MVFPSKKFGNESYTSHSECKYNGTASRIHLYKQTQLTHLFCRQICIWNDKWRWATIPHRHPATFTGDDVIAAATITTTTAAANIVVGISSFDRNHVLSAVNKTLSAAEYKNNTIFLFVFYHPA